MMKVSLTLIAFDKMSRVIRDAVTKSNEEFDKLQDKIKKTSEILDNLGQTMTKVGAGLTLAGGGLAHKLGITEAIPEAFELEHRLRDNYQQSNWQRWTNVLVLFQDIQTN